MNQLIINQDDTIKLLIMIRKSIESNCDCVDLLSSYGVSSKDASRVAVDAIKEQVESRIKPTSVSKDFKL